MTKIAAGADTRPGRSSVLCVQPVAEQGGSDQALLRLGAQLTSAGWVVHVALPGPSPMAADFEAAGIHQHIVPMQRLSTSHGAGAWLGYALRWPVSVGRLWMLARSCQADVLQSNSLHTWYGWAAALLARKPHVWQAREIVTQSRAALAVERLLARRFASEVLAVSEAVAAQLVPGNVTVVYEEADPALWHPGRAGLARQRWGLPDDVLLVGCASRLDTWKGIGVLLDALALLAGRQPTVQAVIAGGPVKGKESYAQALEARARQLGVAWLGPLSGHDAGDLIADLDCLAQPSTGPEPWGLALVEALACGSPVVCSGAGGPVEIMAGLPQAAGRLVPPGDPVALAEAISSVLPPTTSTELRKQRAVLRSGPPAPYPEIFARALAAGRARSKARRASSPLHG